MTRLEHSGPWVSKSSDGYYAIARGGPPWRSYYIEALWATPVEIGAPGAITLELAQTACEIHSQRNTAPA